MRFEFLASFLLARYCNGWTTYCSQDEYVSCTKFKQCVGSYEDGQNYYRMVFCNENHVVKMETIGVRATASCVAAEEVECGTDCGNPCPEDDEPEYDDTSGTSGFIPYPGAKCEENSVIAVSCEKYKLCLGGKMRSVHCNAGLVHDGFSTECQPPKSLPLGSKCGYAKPTATPTTAATSARECVENAVAAESCTTFRLCLGGKQRLVHCNAGLVHDGFSASCVPAASIPCGTKCGKPCPGCEHGSVRASDCHSFEICLKGTWQKSYCAAGLVHVGNQAQCVQPWTLACGTVCAKACPAQCQSGAVTPVNCFAFDRCVDGKWQRANCKNGLVHVGGNKCVLQSNVACGSSCGKPCPTVKPISCQHGDVLPINCRKFRYCMRGSWKTSFCKAGLVHLGTEAKCVPKTSLTCGSTCADECPPACEEGSVAAIDCNRFQYCYKGDWKMSYCKPGLVHLGIEAICVPKHGLTCGTHCANVCPTVAPITECEPGSVKSQSCSTYSVCNDHGEFAEKHCPTGTVHVPGATCVDESVISCEHECGPECPPPVICPACPIHDCPECPKLIEYKCPCSQIKSTISDLKHKINLLVNMELKDIPDESCESIPVENGTLPSAPQVQIIPFSM